MNDLSKFTDEELKAELYFREERRNIEIYLGNRKAIGYFNYDDGNGTEELHIVFDNTTKHCFHFVFKEEREKYRLKYFPNLPVMEMSVWYEMMNKKRIVS